MAVDGIDATHIGESGTTLETLDSTKPGPAMRGGRRIWLVATAVAVFLVLGFVFFRSTGQDDSYISYWPAHTLARYGSIVNYNGDAVEQSSSLLWVLLLGGLAFVTRASVPLLGPLLSIAGGVLAILVASRLAARMDRRAFGYAVFLVATATYIMYWSFSGMEASLTGACTAWLAIVYSDYVAGRRTRKPEIFAATLCCTLVRPEMTAVLCVLLAGLAGTLWVRRQRGLLDANVFKDIAARIGLLALMVVGVSLALAATRMLCFHSLVPESAMVKGGKHPHLHEGLTYLLGTASRTSVLVAMCLALVGIVWTLREAIEARALNTTRLVSVWLVIAYSAFIVWVGGDWMLAGRFLVHVLPVALVLAAAALVRFTPPRWLPAAGLAIVLIQAFSLVLYARKFSVAASPSASSPAVDLQAVSDLSWFDRTDRLFLRDAPVADALDRVVGRMRAAGHSVSHIFSGQMGIVMYRLATRHLGHIDVTDRHGLADRRLATCSLAADRPRLTNGLWVEYPWFLGHRNELQRDCQIPVPDIIYDIEPVQSRARVMAIKKNGYALVYHQVCDVPRIGGLLGGDRVPLDEYIAVRRDLLSPLGLREVPVDQFADSTL